MMKHTLLILLVLVVTNQISAQTTEFTYQGQLQNSSAIANGNFDFEFALFDAQSGGSQLGSTQTRNGVGVANGIFSVDLDFGNVFPGTNRFLEIRVRQSGGGAFSALSPRQSITSSPYAVKSINAESSTVAINAITANNATNAQNSINFSGPLAGDVTGNQGSTTVARLQGRSVTNTAPTTGQVLRFNGTQWEPATNTAAPTAGSPDYIQNSAVAQPSANFNISGNGTAAGTLSGNVLNAATQFNLGGTRILTATNEFFGSMYFGFGAGTNGLANTFFGYQAGQANSTSNNAGANSFFGRRAGTSNTDGGDNSFFGSDAGTANTTGSRNSFFGRSAGVSVTEGIHNSFFGRSAGLLTTAGEGNTFVGANTGISNTTGSNNTLLGHAANVGSTVSFGTAIGSGAVATQSNTVVLGRPADDVSVPGTLTVTGALTANGSGLNNLNASNITAGTLAATRGGTGLAASGAAGNFLRSNGATWISSPLQAADLPTGSGSYIQNSAVTQAASNFNISGTGTASTFNATSQYNISNQRVLSHAGTNNLFVGVNAGTANTGGSFNAFFGGAAGQANTDGGDNAIFGASAGRSNTIGSFNAFFGTRAGEFTTGFSNSFFGTNAGNGNTTGLRNTIIGAGADVTSNSLTNATAIGYRAGVSQNNSLVLGSTFGVNGAIDDTKVGIGTPAPGAKLHVAANGGQIMVGDADCASGVASIGFAPTLECTNYALSGSTANTFINRPTGGGILFRENNVDQVRIAAGGNVGIGTTTPDDRLDVNGSIRVSTLGPGGMTGLCRNASNQISTCSSSLRYKTNFNDFKSGLSLIDQLKPITFDWKGSGTHDLGLGAEDVAAIEPLLVTYNAKGEVEGVKYDRIGVVLINAVKEQQKMIEAQQNQINELKMIVCQSQRSTGICKEIK